MKPSPENRVLSGFPYSAGAALYTVVARAETLAALWLDSRSVFASDYRLSKDAEGMCRWPERIY
jgi:hypothetical protein